MTEPTDIVLAYVRANGLLYLRTAGGGEHCVPRKDRERWAAEFRRLNPGKRLPWEGFGRAGVERSPDLPTHGVTD